jgi:hypothetical protein
MSTTLSFFQVTGDYQAVDDVIPQSTTSTPDLDAVSALVTFTPRLPKGFQAFIADYQVSSNTNNKQTIQVIGAVTGGTYALSFQSVWTTDIAPGISAATLQTTLRALSTIGAGNVNVTGPTGGPYDVEFVGALANQTLPQMLADWDQLEVSSGAPAVSVVMLQPGSTSRIAPTALSFPPRVGRIWTNGRLCSINVADSVGVDLVPNLPALGMDFDLIYDVTYSAVRFNGVNQVIAPFAFKAPVDTTAVCITDPALDRLPYEVPLRGTWYPGWDPTIDPSGSGGGVFGDPWSVGGPLWQIWSSHDPAIVHLREI